MNSVQLIGRLTATPEVRYTESKMAVTQFAIAINRGRDKNGEDRGADFPRVTVFGKTAENCAKYLVKGGRVAIMGRIQTGSYTNSDGKKVFTTEIIADRVEFIDFKNTETVPGGMEEINDDELPF